MTVIGKDSSLAPKAPARAVAAIATSVGAVATRTLPPSATQPAVTTVTQSGNWLPLLNLVTASGLLLVVLGNLRGLAGESWSEAIFWAGLIVIIAPTTLRLTAASPTRGERIGLILWMGGLLYLVKVLHSPFAFTFSDEFIHAFNTRAILESGTLFTRNLLLHVSSFYPGLSMTTAAVADLGNLPIFYAGLTVIGAARLILYLGFFLFTEQASGSARVAGLATVLYMCHSNFLFWSAQFSYESLSFPLAVAILFITARRQQQASDQSIALMALAMLGIVAVAITHHVTSYFLTILFLLWWVIIRFRLNLLIVFVLNVIVNPRVEEWLQPQITPVHEGETTTSTLAQNPMYAQRWLFILFLFALTVVLAWLVFAASATTNYLSQVLTKALLSMIQMIGGEQTGRQLFVSNTGVVAPLWERVVGLGSVVLCLLGLPWGLWQIWRKDRYNPLALLLVLAALGYFVMLGFRLTPAGWETGNRASGYMFVGLSFVLAQGLIGFWMPQRARWWGSILIACYVCILFIGGVLSGWPRNGRLALPYLVEAQGEVIRPAGLMAAEWMYETLGPDNPVAVDEANGRYTMYYGRQKSLVGRYPNTKELLLEPDMPNWQYNAIKREELQYIFMDRRHISWDNMAGYFFDRTTNGALPPKDLVEPQVYTKFDHQWGVTRIWDSGNIVIYDINRLLKAILDAQPSDLNDSQ
ncbi:MAG: hypothetical protein R3C14_18475 [Caldilineaceae bacterium]